MEQVRKIIYYRGYFNDFFDKQSKKVKEKIEYVLFLITVAERIPIKFFKHIEGTDGLYEIRIELEGNIYRVFCCFDKGQIVVLLNGFQKKSQKTPNSEIEKALRIKNDYFINKSNKRTNDKEEIR